MKLDYGLVREILLAMEAAPANTYPELQLEDREDDDVFEHAELLMEAGLIEGKAHHGGMGEARVVAVHLERLTWDGHQFLANAKNETLWRKATGIVVEKGGSVTIRCVKGALEETRIPAIRTGLPVIAA
ncbi:MAG: DUF2513 domain-containing protein [Gemmatimonadaceae bacterium]